MTLAAPNRFRENVPVQPVVISELEFSHVERKVFTAHLVIAAHHAALNQRPKTFNRVRVQSADNVLVAMVIYYAMLRVFCLQVAISEVSVRRKQFNICRDSLLNKAMQRGH